MPFDGSWKVSASWTKGLRPLRLPPVTPRSLLASGMCLGRALGSKRRRDREETLHLGGDRPELSLDGDRQDYSSQPDRRPANR